MGIIRSLSSIVLIGIAVAGLTITSARADILTFNYSALIFTSTLNAGQLSSDDAGEGITITGTFTYNSAAADGAFFAAGGQEYDPALSAISVDFLSGANTSIEGSFLRILDDCCPGSRDEFFMKAGTAASGSEFTGTLDYVALEADIILLDNTGTVFTGLGLPTGFDISDFTSAVFQFVGSDAAEREDRFAANITALTAVAVVPIPAALPLFLTGLAGLALIRRRQRQT